MRCSAVANGMRAYPLVGHSRELGTYSQRITLDQGVNPKSGDRMPEAINEDRFGSGASADQLIKCGDGGRP
jgi:hypothetical protein